MIDTKCSSTCCTNQVDEVKILGKEYDAWKENVFTVDISKWVWDVEYFKTVALLTEIFTQSMAINDECDLDWFLWLIAQEYIADWDKFYAKLVHNFWSLIQYFFYFIYGAVWEN